MMISGWNINTYMKCEDYIGVNVINSRQYGPVSMNYSGPSLQPLTNCTIKYVTSNLERKKKQKEIPESSEIERQIACSEDADFINSIISHGGTILGVGENVNEVTSETHEQAAGVEIPEATISDKEEKYYTAEIFKLTLEDISKIQDMETYVKDTYKIKSDKLNEKIVLFAKHVVTSLRFKNHVQNGVVACLSRC